MSDGDGPNLENFLPFSLREVPLARAFLNGKRKEFSIEMYYSFFLKIIKV